MSRVDEQVAQASERDQFAIATQQAVSDAKKAWETAQLEKEQSLRMQIK